MTERHECHEPMEELLRAALSARADSITAPDLRPLGPPVGGVGSSRSRWLTITAPLAVFVAAAAALAAVTLTGAPDSYNGSPQRPGASPTAGASANRETQAPGGPAAPAEATPESPPEPASTPPGTSAPLRRSTTSPTFTSGHSNASTNTPPPIPRSSGTAAPTGQPSGSATSTPRPSGTAAPTSAAPSTTTEPHGSTEPHDTKPPSTGPDSSGAEPSPR
ncbi:hypothetical protein [Streptomyces sp. SID3343]|uniref:hypothetical protein n=1 Tax=Streptomyces sp. SID3343 TaxID=2690260 RepID=UPI00136816DA|nr:hypothetical protein [Streptomyces sp. SID3343]MYW01509.1 hypothetical protein [Streptomyces sp. SID3343]